MSNSSKVSYLREKQFEVHNSLDNQPAENHPLYFNNTQTYNFADISREAEDQPNLGYVVGSATKKASAYPKKQFKNTIPAKDTHGMANIGPFVMKNNLQLAQEILNHPKSGKLFTQIHGSSSATNKAKKAFNFELDHSNRNKKDKLKNHGPAK